jgi:hypothetical protein
MGLSSHDVVWAIVERIGSPAGGPGRARSLAFGDQGWNAGGPLILVPGAVYRRGTLWAGGLMGRWPKSQAPSKERVPEISILRLGRSQKP